MTIQFPRHDFPERSVSRAKAGSKLVQRLISADNDPAKERLRSWLSALDDHRLIKAGLAPEDIALLRGEPEHIPAKAA